MHLIFEINQYGLNVKDGVQTRELMPIEPLSAVLLIETPDNVDTVESTQIVGNEIHYHIDKRYTNFIGVSRMQLVLTDENCCRITLPEFSFEVRESIAKDLYISTNVATDSDNIALATENGDLIIIGKTLIETDSPISLKYIKNLSYKDVITGDESLLAQDNEGAKQIPLSVIVDRVLEESMLGIDEAIDSFNDVTKQQIENNQQQIDGFIEETQTRVDEVLNDANQINQKMNQMQSDVDVQNRRIDAIVALPDGSTTADAELVDIRIGIDGVNYKSAGDSVRSQMELLRDNLGCKSINLFDHQCAEIGYYNPTTGELNSSNDMRMTGLIRYNAGDIIRKNKDVDWFSSWISFFDIDGNIITSSINIDGYTNRTNPLYDELCIPTIDDENIKYIRVAVSNYGQTTNFEDYMVVKNHDFPDHYIPFGFVYSDNLTDKIKDEINNTIDESSKLDHKILNIVNQNMIVPTWDTELDGKTLLFTGDSIMMALIDNLDGTYGEAYGWAEMIQENNPLANIKNYGVGGTTISKKEGQNDSILERLDKMFLEYPNADYCIFEGGVNDCYAGVPIGEITPGYNDSFDEYSFCGALESLFKQAILKWKGKKLGYIVTFKVPSADYANFDEYMSKAKKICEKWSIPYVDLYTQSGMEYHIEEIAIAYSYGGGGLHPNVDGYKVTVPKIEKWIKSL